MSEKRKLILKFALDCLLIVLYFLTMAAHSFALTNIIGLCFVLLANYLPRKKRDGRLWWSRFRLELQGEYKLTVAEVIAFFAIAISAIYIFAFTKAASLIYSPAFIIPIGVILLAVRLLYFSKELAALQTPKPASN